VAEGVETPDNDCRKDLAGGSLASILRELGFAQDAGDNAARVSSFYEEAREFLTRVVGIQHEGCRDVLEDLAVGEEVLLVWEQENPYDPKALRVVT
jgi:hypothetical protein